MELSQTFFGKLKGSGLKTRLLHPWDELWDRRLGVYTTLGDHSAGGVDGRIAERVHYAPTPFAVILRLLRHVALSGLPHPGHRVPRSSRALSARRRRRVAGRVITASGFRFTTS